VAAPILDAGGQVLGLCTEIGGRTVRRSSLQSRLEAMLVELLASGWRRFGSLEQERAAVAARVRMEQFFTPQLARKLEVDSSCWLAAMPW